MCGRFVRSFTVNELIEEIRAIIEVPKTIAGNDAEPHFNVAPTTLIHGVQFVNEDLEIDLMQWGFRGFTSTDSTTSSAPIINARSETVAEKPTFRGLLQGNRCVIPMDGFYEWQREGSRKTPFYVSREDERRMWVAGLWRPRVSDGGRDVCLLTRESVDDLAAIHHRSPVQLELSDAVEWISQPDPPMHLLTTISAPRMRSWSVSREVNSVRNNHPRLIEPDLSAQTDTGEPTLFD
jgi:putative SOS response-associated peptidase YedK